MLKSERITLRPWRNGDEESLVKYGNNRSVSKNLRDRFQHPYTLADAENWIKIAIQGRPGSVFAIEMDSHAVGGVGLLFGDDIFRRTAELGYWLGEPYWGKGIVTEAVKLITEHAFKSFELERIFAGVFSTNPASARVLEKAGYQFEGKQQKSVFKDGQVLDQLIYVSLR